MWAKVPLLMPLEEGFSYGCFASEVCIANFEVKKSQGRDFFTH
jgi:hypothetical protein